MLISKDDMIEFYIFKLLTQVIWVAMKLTR